MQNPQGFKGKKHFTTMDFNQSGFKIKDGKIKLSHSYNNIPLEFDMPEKFGFGSDDNSKKKVKQVSIFRFKDGDFYLSITYDEKLEKEYVDNGLYQAFDLGLGKQTAVNIDGKFFEAKNRRPEKYWEKKIEKAQSRLDHCKCGSGRWNRLKKSIRTMQKKATDQRKDFQHKLSRKIVENTKANTIIVGDLDVKEMAQEKEKK
jgi:putative transposase